ncbi:MAG: hypothetical protein LH475_10035 [Cryobacterium sp.]|nr:hypothetical protein [Cryobacterium sp.]
MLTGAVLTGAVLTGAVLNAAVSARSPGQPDSQASIPSFLRRLAT